MKLSVRRGARTNPEDSCSIDQRSLGLIGNVISILPYNITIRSISRYAVLN
jgi:hypothetical protein